MEREEFRTAIGESPESSWRWRELITAVGELPEARAVDTG